MRSTLKIFFKKWKCDTHIDEALKNDTENVVVKVICDGFVDKKEFLSMEMVPLLPKLKWQSPYSHLVLALLERHDADSVGIESRAKIMQNLNEVFKQLQSVDGEVIEGLNFKNYNCAHAGFKKCVDNH